MSENKIKQALECVANAEIQSCIGKECPYFEFDNDCTQLLAIDVLNLLNHKDIENSKLKKSNRNWRRKVQRLKVKLGMKDLEYSCLERERADDIGEFVEELKSVEAEAYKECFEKVKAYFRETRFAYDAENLCEELDDLLKEKIGENNDTM